MKYFIYILLLLCTIHLQSQSIEPRNDLKVGVVLSGGGAKGLAHIGALKAFEEAGIQIDFIGGTSMGAIVGGLYASGYSASDLKKILPSLGLEGYMEDGIPRKIKPFNQREAEDKYVLRLPIVDKNLLIPRGINKGHAVLNKISQYTQHVNDIECFSELPIPFLCIATDLEKGEQVILDKGYLPNALRASSAYPTLLTPIEIDGKVLVDGGIVNNFPVEEVLAMGADIVIGVDVSSTILKSKDDLQSLPDMMDQLISYQMITDKKNDKKNKTTLYIRPDISEYTVTSFDKYREIIEKGMQASLVYADVLEKIASNQNPHYTPEIVKPDDQNEFVIEQINITGNKSFSYAYIIEKLQIKLGKKLSYQDFYTGIDRLAATDQFNSIQHRIIDSDSNTLDGKIIHIEVVENTVKSYFQLGLHYDPVYKAGVLLNVSKRNLLFQNDHISADLVVGDHLRHHFNYFIDNGVNMSLGLQSVSQNFDYNTNFTAENSTFQPEMNHLNLSFSQYNNRVYIQGIYKDNIALGLGAHHKYIKAETQNNESETFMNSHYLSPCVYFKYDSFDDKTFPKKGLLFTGNAHWYLWSDDTRFTFTPFAQGQLNFGYAFSFFDRLSTQINSEAGIAIGSNSNPFLDYHLGGMADTYMSQFVPFYGYDFASFGNNAYLKSSVKLQYEWTKNHYISAVANIARAEQDVLFKGQLFDNTKKGFALQYGVKTIAGPIRLTYSYSPDIEKHFWNINIGYWF